VLVAVVATYALVEAVATIRYLVTSAPPDPYWIYEDSGRTIRFDPIRGYRLSSTPSRFARISHGEVEYVGHIRGNNQGFPDRDDFHPRRERADGARLAVMGDSFTSAQFIEMNWPDRVEERIAASGGRITLMNFAVDGAGLANWWSILRGIIEPEAYELDGIIFACYWGDLRRPFTFADHTVGTRANLTRLRTDDPKVRPRSLTATSCRRRTSNVGWLERGDPRSCSGSRLLTA
jgi:hypothetical protein